MPCPEQPEDRTMRAVFAAVMLALGALSAHAASPFDGVWIDELKTQMGDAGSDVYLIANGIYNCTSCSPPRAYPADGKARPVPGDTSVITELVSIAGPLAIKTRIVGPHMIRDTTMTVAADDQTAAYVSLDKWPGRPKLLRTQYLAKRVAPSPPGAHAASGSWLGIAYIEVPEDYRSVDLHEADGVFTRSNFRHGHYAAKIEGPAVLLTGDGQDVYMAQVHAPDARTRVETILLKGKPVVERTYRISEDGQSLLTAVREPGNDNVFSTTSHRK